MTRLDRYVVRQISWPAVLAFFVVTFLGLAQEIREQLNDIPAEFLTPWDLLRLALFMTPLFFPIVAPIALFFGILFGCAHMADHSELTAIKAAGVSMRRLARPIIAAGLLLTVAAFLIQDQLQPRAIAYAYGVMFRELPDRISIDSLSPGVMHKIGDHRVHFVRSESDPPTLYDVDLLLPYEPGKSQHIMHIDSARVYTTPEHITFELGPGYAIGTDNYFMEFPSGRIEVPRDIRALPASFTARLTRNVGQLLAAERELSETLAEEPTVERRKDLLAIRNEIAERLGFPFAAFGIALVGAGTALHVRRAARSWAFATGFTVIVAFFVLKIMTEATNLAPLWESIFRAWIPNLFLLGLGAFQMYRVDRI